MTFGFMGPPLTGREKVIWKTEGPTDAMAILSLLAKLDLLPEHTAICNACGAGESPVNQHSGVVDFIKRFGGASEVFVIHDCDKPGQAGATWVTNGARRRPGWATAIAQHNRMVRNVVLPYPIEETNGKDVRDWIVERIDAGKSSREIYDELLAYARSQEIIDLAETAIQAIEQEGGADAEGQAESLPGGGPEGDAGGPDTGNPDADGEEEEQPVEAPDDPHRLARLNLRSYREDHKGTLRYWRQQWYRHRDGRYREISTDDLRAKVTQAIKAEFNSLWREEKERYEEWITSPDYDERRDKGVPVCRPVRPHVVAGVLDAMKSMCLIPESCEVPCWLPDRSKRNYISVRNGIVDLDGLLAGKPQDEFLLPHSPDWFSTVRLDYPFDPLAQCPKWIDFLFYAMENDTERIAILQEWAGYLLTNENQRQKFLALEGEGKNGKSVFFAGMIALLGSDNVGHVPIENFISRFDLATTIGKAANISGDAGVIEVLAEGVLKQYVDGNEMLFDRKNRDPIFAKPTAKLMCAWNTRPRFHDKSDSVWRRILLIPFERIVEEHRRVFGMDKPEFWADEAAGILNWAICGLHRLNEQRQFTESEKSEMAKEEYKEESNPAIEFLMQHVRMLSGNQLEEELKKKTPEQWAIPSQEVYSLYQKWCKENGVKPMNSANFGRQVIRKFGNVKHRRSYGNREWTYRLLTLETEF